MIIPHNLCRMLVCSGRRVRRPLQKIITYAMFCCRGGRPLHRQRSLCLLEFYHDKIHRLRCGVSSSQKISGTTLIFRGPCFIKIKIIFSSPNESADESRPRLPVKCSTHFAIFRKIKIFTQNHHQASYPKYAPRGRNNPSCSRAHNY